MAYTVTYHWLDTSSRTIEYTGYHTVIAKDGFDVTLFNTVGDFEGDYIYSGDQISGKNYDLFEESSWNITEDEDTYSVRVTYDGNGHDGGYVPAHNNPVVGEDILSGHNFNYIVLSGTPTRNGYDFEGWYCSYNGNIYQEGETITISAYSNVNLVLTAMWIESQPDTPSKNYYTYKIIYNLGDNVTGAPDNIEESIEHGDDTIVYLSKPNISRPGYELENVVYYIDGEYQGQITDTEIAITIYCEMTIDVTANWQPIPIIIIEDAHTDTPVIKAGDPIVLSINASGYNLSYQWQYSHNSGVVWSNLLETDPSVTGANANTVTIIECYPDYSDYLWRCIITSENGETAESDNVTFSVIIKRPMYVKTQDGWVPCKLKIKTSNGWRSGNIKSKTVFGWPDGSDIASFTIKGVEFTTKKGMTWQQWVNSEHNVESTYYNASGNDGTLDFDDLINSGKDPSKVSIVNNAPFVTGYGYITENSGLACKSTDIIKPIDYIFT